MTVRLCLQCSEEIPPSKARRAIFCSKSCGSRHYYYTRRKVGAKLSNRNCLQCNIEFKPKIITTKFCSNSCNNKWYRSLPENSDLRRNESLKRRYGISLEDRNNMELEQNGVCAICGGDGYDRLVVDHDHKTGKIRGLLCDPCNCALGYFKDNEDIIMAAFMYLNSSKMEVASYYDVA